MQSEDIQKNSVIKVYISTQFNIKRKQKAYGKLKKKLVITVIITVYNTCSIIHCSSGNSTLACTVESPKESEFWKT